MDPVDLDLDELFGNENVIEDPSFGVPLVSEDVALPLVQPMIISPALIQHIRNIQHAGCNQRIAWSRQGCIAVLSPDSLHVFMHCLRFDRLSGLWSISEASIVNADTFADPAVHIQWSPSGVDLSVVDIFGRVSVFTVALAANRMNLARPSTLDLAQDSRQVVGLFWLNQDREVGIPNLNQLAIANRLRFVA